MKSFCFSSVTFGAWSALALLSGPADDGTTVRDRVERLQRAGSAVEARNALMRAEAEPVLAELAHAWPRIEASPDVAVRSCAADVLRRFDAASRNRAWFDRVAGGVWDPATERQCVAMLARVRGADEDAAAAVLLTLIETTTRTTDDPRRAVSRSSAIQALQSLPFFPSRSRIPESERRVVTRVRDGVGLDSSLRETAAFADLMLCADAGERATVVERCPAASRSALMVGLSMLSSAPPAREDDACLREITRELWRDGLRSARPDDRLRAIETTASIFLADLFVPTGEGSRTIRPEVERAMHRVAAQDEDDRVRTSAGELLRRLNDSLERR